MHFHFFPNIDVSSQNVPHEIRPVQPTHHDGHVGRWLKGVFMLDGIAGIMSLLHIAIGFQLGHIIRAAQEER